MKIQKIKFSGEGTGVGSGGVSVDLNKELGFFLMKIQKQKIGGGGGRMGGVRSVDGGVRVNVKEEVKFL